MGYEREDEMAVCDRRSKRRFALTALDIDVYPLVVPGSVGEAVDQLLIYLAPCSDADLLADEGAKPVDAHDRALRSYLGCAHVPS